MSDGNESDAFAHLNSGSDAELPSESEFVDSDSEGSDAGSGSDAPRRTRRGVSDDESDASGDGSDDNLDSEKEDEDKTAGMSNLQREEYMYALSLRNQERRERRAMIRMMKQQKERRAAEDKAAGKAKKSKDKSGKKEKKDKKEKKEKKDKKAKKDKKEKKRSKRRAVDSDDDDEYDEVSARKSVRDVLSGGFSSSTGSLSSDHHKEIAKLLASKQKGKAGAAHMRDVDLESDEEGFDMAEFVDDFVDDDDEDAGGMGSRDAAAPRRRTSRPSLASAATASGAVAEVEDDGRVLELKHIKKVQIRRVIIAKMLSEPYFNTYLPGLFVRVTRARPDGGSETLCAEIMEVFLPPTARLYALEKTTTDKRVRVRHGSETIELPFLPVSNQSITEEEFDAFVAATRAAGRKPPTPAQLDRLYVQKENLRRTFVSSAETVLKTLQERQRVKRVVTDFEKERIDLVGRIERVRALIRADVASVKTEGADVGALEASSLHYPELQTLERELKVLTAAQQRQQQQHQRDMREAGITRVYELSSRSQGAKWAKYSDMDLNREEVYVSEVARLFGADKRDWSSEIDRLTHAPGVAPVSAPVAAAAAEAAALAQGSDRKRRRRAPLTAQLAHLYGHSLPFSLAHAAAAAAVTDPIAARDAALEAARVAAGPVLPPQPAEVGGVRLGAGSDPAAGLVTLGDLNAYAAAGALAQAPQPMMG